MSTRVTDFTVDLDSIESVGSNLTRPECVLCEPDGTLWVSDNRGLLTRRSPDGTQTLFGEGEIHEADPNGIGMDRDGALLVTGMSSGVVYRMQRDGHIEVILDSIDGQPLGAVNYVFVDEQDRMWISVSTRRQPYVPALMSDPIADGCVILVDKRGPRIVADGIRLTNELRIDPTGQYVYVVESMESRILRFPIQANGDLGDREIAGPDQFGPGDWPDGIAFDAEGNLWITFFTTNELKVLTPEGDVHTVFSDRQAEKVEIVAQDFIARNLAIERVFACASPLVGLCTSVNFGGPDLRDVYIGSLALDRLLTFRSPVPGHPMPHWQR